MKKRNSHSTFSCFHKRKSVSKSINQTIQRNRLSRLLTYERNVVLLQEQSLFYPFTNLYFEQRQKKYTLKRQFFKKEKKKKIKKKTLEKDNVIFVLFWNEEIKKYGMKKSRNISKHHNNLYKTVREHILFNIQFTRELWSKKKNNKVEYGLIKGSGIHTETQKKICSALPR